MAKLSQELHRYFFEEDRPEKVTLSNLLNLAGERVFGFLLILLSLPSALPIPAPGYSIPFGIVMFLLGGQLVFGLKQPWLPRKILRGGMKTEKVRGFVKAGIPWLQRLENLTKPRLTVLCTSLPGRVVIGSAIALMSVSMMIPIPFTNTLPAMGIFVTSFGLIEDDGIISLGGLLICLLGISLSSAILISIFYLGMNADQAGEAIKTFIQGLF